jgi:hypothetical protein
MAGFAAFPNKRLCDVVFPGTHDAGIYGTALGATAKTQNLSLGEQAAAGVRYFDLRIATIKTAAGLEQRAYHAPALKQKTSAAGNYQQPSLSKKVAVGVFTGYGADRLSQMLDQAREFVLKDPGGEFLILRFSKCGDMEEVVNQCLLKLGNEHFSRNVNLNEALVSSLQGKVITVFDHEDFIKFPVELKAVPGILPVKALFNSGGPHATYDPLTWGLQYFGKYSNTRSAEKNIGKQMQTLAQGPTSSPELLGMMYWTLTTKIGEKLTKTFESLQARDQKMWSSAQQAMTSAWKAGVKDHIIARAGHQHRQWLTNGYPPTAVGRSAKSFMPNIIMMDFADPSRCATIWNLNLATADLMTRMAGDLTNVGRIL